MEWLCKWMVVFMTERTKKSKKEGVMTKKRAGEKKGMGEGQVDKT